MEKKIGKSKGKIPHQMNYNYKNPTANEIEIQYDSTGNVFGSINKWMCWQHRNKRTRGISFFGKQYFTS